MSDLRQQTIDVYNRSAEQMAAKFRRIGARTEDIGKAFDLAGNPSAARILELGCGDGRDALEIVKRAGWYLGVDPAAEFIRLAKEYVPEGKFAEGEAATLKYPEKLDIIFAFASLLHSDREEVERVLQKAHRALKPGGIFYISLKWAPEYSREITKDQFGERLFYFYNPEIIAAMAGKDYAVAYTDQQTREGMNHAEWFTIALRNN